MLFMLIVFGQYFANFLTFEEIPQAIANGIIAVAQGPVAVSLMILVYVVLGMFLESAAMLLITVPIFEPVAHQLGMDPLVFGIFACIAMDVARGGAVHRRADRDALRRLFLSVPGDVATVDHVRALMVRAGAKNRQCPCT
jgi:hypothetical protein